MGAEFDLIKAFVDVDRERQEDRGKKAGRRNRRANIRFGQDQERDQEQADKDRAAQEREAAGAKSPGGTTLHSRRGAGNKDARRSILSGGTRLGAASTSRRQAGGLGLG